MARCNECNSVVTRQDSECYICSQPVPKARRQPWQKKEPKSIPPVTPVSNLLFIASLALTLASFLLTPKMPLWLSLTLSGSLFIARIFTDRMAARQQSALGPVTVTRLDY